MSHNFFSALDDSDDEGEVPKPVVVHKEKNEIPNEINVARDDKRRHLEGGPLKSDRRHAKNIDRNNKAGRGRLPQAREGKRTYDRRSGTGRGREVKKGGSGAHNWGSDKYEARKAEGSITEQDHEEKRKGNAPTTDVFEGKTKLVDDGAEEDTTKEDVPKEEGRKKVEEEKDNTMTLEEFLKSKTDPSSDLFKPKEVKAVDNEFAGKTASKTITDDFLTMGIGKNLRKKGNKKPDKVTIDVAFRNAKPTSDNRKNGDRPRRGGTPGGRGRPNRGDRKGEGDRRRRGDDNTAKTTLDAMDTNAFPSL